VTLAPAHVSLLPLACQFQPLAIKAPTPLLPLLAHLPLLSLAPTPDPSMTFDKKRLADLWTAKQEDAKDLANFKNNEPKRAAKCKNLMAQKEAPEATIRSVDTQMTVMDKEAELGR